MSGYSGTKPKRSTSLSHIPVAASLREARSSIRGKTRCEAPTRKRSSDQKLLRSSSCSNLLRTTPLQSKHSVGRTSSTRKIPSSASRSPFMKRDRPVNDKKWIAEQFTKVRRYLEDHPDCDPNILNNLKPPTLNTFVYVCNILFKGLDPRIQIDMSNYRETVIAQLKTLHYPGSVSNSLLKTVNTMHAWPQVVGILSWIVDLLAFIATNTINQDTRDVGSELKEVVLNYFGERYMLFNSNDNQTMPDETFVEQISAIYGINNEDQNECIKTVENLKTVRDEKVSQLTKITDEINILRKENDKMSKEIQKFNLEDPTQEKQQQNNLQMLTHKKQETKKMIVNVKNNIDQLRATISNQRCSYAEKNSILSHINEMKYTLELKKEKQEEYRKIRSDFDYKLVDLTRKVETEVFRLNTAIVQISLNNPEIRSLYLRDKGFHQQNFQNEIEEFIRTKMNLEDKVMEDIVKARTHIETSESRGKILCDNIKNLQEITEELILKKEELEKQIQTADKAYRGLAEDIEQLKKQHLLSINDLKGKELNLDDLKKQISKLIEDKSLLEEDFNMLQLDSLKFFEKLHNTSIESLKELDKLRTQICEKINEETTLKNHMNISKQFDLINEYIENINPNILSFKNKELK